MNWKKYLPVIGIILFVYILIKLDVRNILVEISKANWFLLIISLLLIPLFLTTETLKWLILAYKQKINVPLKEAFKINLISNFYGFVTPSKFGAIIRAEYLRKYTKNIGKGISNFVLDKVLDVGSVFFLAILFSFVFREKLEFLPLNLFIFIFLSLVLITLIFIKKERSKFILGVFYRKLVPEKLKEKTKLTFDSFYEDMPKKRYFCLFFLLNIINWIMAYFITFLIALSLNINLSFIHFLAILPLGTIATLIPVTISGLGTREAALIGLFGLFGISATKVFSMSILALLIVGIFPSIIGIILIFKKKENEGC